MWEQGWRDQIWSQLAQPWDVVIVGGGITGVGILREATRVGLRALLVEQRDFAWGASSRSSKFVHGGLRYLARGQVKLTWESVRERDRLLEDASGLVSPLGFLLPTYRGERPGPAAYRAVLWLYEAQAAQSSRRHYQAEAFHWLAPYLSTQGLTGGFGYRDAQTDDARLVLRLLREAVAAGGTALNYVAAESVLEHDGRVVGVRLRDVEQERDAEVTARVVVNATGAWADQLRGQVGAPARMLPLRGSHLIFPAWRLPVAQAISFAHPDDHRMVFICPWEGVTLVGTTDLRHHQPLDAEPQIHPEEMAYLMAALDARFPSLNLTLDDIVATFAGVRPVIGSGKTDPSAEPRDSAVWEEHGLVTVTGGKLTTFRRSALEAIHHIRRQIPQLPARQADVPVLNRVGSALSGLDLLTARRLVGRYGAEAAAVVAAAQPGELESIGNTPLLWAELRWAAHAEGITHLDDLLLRRVRLGLLLPAGGAALLPTIRAICQPALGWDDARWETEQQRYTDLWRQCYSLPEPQAIPSWDKRGNILAEATS